MLVARSTHECPHERDGTVRVTVPIADLELVQAAHGAVGRIYNATRAAIGEAADGVPEIEGRGVRWKRKAIRDSGPRDGFES